MALSPDNTLQENLFENVPHPDGYNFEEYVESRMPTRMQIGITSRGERLSLLLRTRGTASASWAAPRAEAG